MYQNLWKPRDFPFFEWTKKRFIGCDFTLHFVCDGSRQVFKGRDIKRTQSNKVRTQIKWSHLKKKLISYLPSYENENNIWYNSLHIRFNGGFLSSIVIYFNSKKIDMINLWTSLKLWIWNFIWFLVYYTCFSYSIKQKKRSIKKF